MNRKRKEGKSEDEQDKQTNTSCNVGMPRNGVVELWRVSMKGCKIAKLCNVAEKHNWTKRFDKMNQVLQVTKKYSKPISQSWFLFTVQY